MSFRVWIDFNDGLQNPPPKKEKKPKANEDDESEESEEDDQDDNKVCKTIRLKMHKIREDVFAYLRTSLM